MKKTLEISGIMVVILLLLCLWFSASQILAQTSDAVIFISNMDGSRKLYVLHPEASQPEPFFDTTPYGHVIAFSLSPDHQQAAFVAAVDDSVQSLYILNVITKIVTNVRSEGVAIGSLSWSPDSSRLLYLTGVFPGEYERGFVFDLHTQTEQKITFPAPDYPVLSDSIIRVTNWSPDGQYFALHLITFLPKQCHILQLQIPMVQIYNFSIWENWA